MRTAVESQIREKYGLNSVDLLIQSVIYEACGLSIREGWPGNCFFVLCFHSWPMTRGLTVKTWGNHLEKDTKEKGAAALHSPRSFIPERLQRSAQVLRIFTTNDSFLQLSPLRTRTFQLVQLLIWHKCHTSKSNTSSFMFSQIINVAKPLFFSSLFWNPKRTANTYSISLEGSQEKSAPASCSGEIMWCSVKGVGEKY